MAFATPFRAATVVILRDRAPVGAGIEVFLVQRHGRSGFMGGAYVFPGGKLDEADFVGDRVALCDGLDIAARRLSTLDEPEAVQYHVAAIRESFEESGLLLARNRDGHLVAFDDDPVIVQRMNEARREVHGGERTLWSVIAREGWRLALDVLVPFAHWVTPEVEPRRFDTRFFLTRAPAGQTPRHDATETVESVWISPADALSAAASDTIVLPPPTWRTLADLAPYGTVDEALAWAEAEPAIRRQPRFFQDGDEQMLVLPGDPLYPAPPHEAMVDPTRFVWTIDRWKPHSA